MDRPGSREYRQAELTRMLDFAAGAAVDRGFAWLDDDGRPVPDRDLELWINARMTYVFSLAADLGHERGGPLAAHGVEALRTVFADPVHGGWYRTVSPDATHPVDDDKDCYDHAFVVLAASAARRAGVEGAAELLDEALAVHGQRFWDEDAGACRERWSAGWTDPEDYRGANSNMHTVEAYLLAAEVTGDDTWRRRALSILTKAIDRSARANGWRVVEHFDADWHPLPEHHRDLPRDPFRPYGATPGHAFEWARLAVQAEAALGPGHDWLLPAAQALHAQALADTADGSALVYTTDWSGRPIVEERFHWVLCEALLAADALHRRTGEASYAAHRDAWWELADRAFVDPRGSWHHELAPDLSPSQRTWSGKPDAYHVVNALVLPDLPWATPTQDPTQDPTP